MLPCSCYLALLSFRGQTCGRWGLNSRLCAWHQAPLPDEPWHSPCYLAFQMRKPVLPQCLRNKDQNNEKKAIKKVRKKLFGSFHL